MATPFQELSRTFSDIADRTYQRTAADEENQRRTEAMRLERAWRESMREGDREFQREMVDQRTEREDLLMNQEMERARVAFDSLRRRNQQLIERMNDGLSPEIRGAVEAMVLDTEFGGEAKKGDRDLYNQRVAEKIQEAIAMRNAPLMAEYQSNLRNLSQVSMKYGFSEFPEDRGQSPGGQGSARNPLDPGGRGDGEEGEKRVIEEEANEQVNRSYRERLGGEENYGAAGAGIGAFVDTARTVPSVPRRIAGMVSGVGGDLIARGSEAVIGQRGIDFLDQNVHGQDIYNWIADRAGQIQMPSARDIAAPVMPQQIPGTMGDPTRFYPRQGTPTEAPPGPVRRGL